MNPDICKLEDFFYGTATLGERGQIVIPADARKDCEIHSGDKLLVFRHPLHPSMLIIAKVGEVQTLMQQMARALEQMQARAQEIVSQEE